MSDAAILALEDGTVYRGRAFGARGERDGEVVFNTSMTGYQEVLTDASYRGQIVAMTYPLIGNYGINDEDGESWRPWLSGFVVRELSRTVSNWRATTTVDAFLKHWDVPGIQGVDTRALTRHIREAGAMKAVLSSVDLDADALVEKAKASPGLIGRDLVREVSCEEPFEWTYGVTGDEPFRVVVPDCGVKYGILRQLVRFGYRPLVVPASTPADRIRELGPDGVMLSNGPGDPAAVPYVVEAARDLIGGDGDPPVPVFGICLGHQMLGQALGGTTYKLKFGHHGANHPVRDERTRRVAITVQNHGFCVDIESLPRDAVEITHVNLNDRTLEGIRCIDRPAFCVQFHPEASAGPHDAHVLFEEFIEMMRTHRA
jgi:carbamoyl-phosphate synthase small subunit